MHQDCLSFDSCFWNAFPVVINEAFVKCVGNRLHCSFLSISRLSFFFFLYFVCIIVKAIHVRAMSQFFLVSLSKFGK